MHTKDSSTTKILHFVAFVLASLVLLTADHRKAIPAARTGLSIIVYPLQVLVDLPYRTTQTVRQFFTSHKTLSDENKELRRLVTIYSARDQKYRSIAAQNERLREALNTAKIFDESYLLSHILSVDTDRFRQTVTINKGTKQGAYEGQIALSGNSIFGQVIHASTRSSVIMQLSDPKHSIPVRNARTGEKALAVGTGVVNIVSLEHIENIEDIKTGDLYLSSGLGLLFPPDFPVAVVQKKHYNPADSMTTISATTVTDFNRTRELLLIWQAEKTAEQQKN
ncbi:MAG: rod shape-determining protein MreC [Thiotrichaceae bacterium]